MEGGGGPGAVYQVFVTMEELQEKLKLLNYEENFCRQHGFKAFSRLVSNISFKYSPIRVTSFTSRVRYH